MSEEISLIVEQCAEETITEGGRKVVKGKRLRVIPHEAPF